MLKKPKALAPGNGFEGEKRGYFSGSARVVCSHARGRALQGKKRRTGIGNLQGDIIWGLGSFTDLLGLLTGFQA